MSDDTYSSEEHVTAIWLSVGHLHVAVQGTHFQVYCQRIQKNLNGEYKISILYLTVIIFKINTKKWVEKQSPTVLLSMNDIKCWHKLWGESVLLTAAHYVRLAVI